MIKWGKNEQFDDKTETITQTFKVHSESQWSLINDGMKNSCDTHKSSHLQEGNL